MKCMSCFNIIRVEVAINEKNIGFELIIIKVGDGKNMSVCSLDFSPYFILHFPKVSVRFAVKAGKIGIRCDP